MFWGMGQNVCQGKIVSVSIFSVLSCGVLKMACKEITSWRSLKSAAVCLHSDTNDSL